MEEWLARWMDGWIYLSLGTSGPNFSIIINHESIENGPLFWDMAPDLSRQWATRDDSFVGNSQGRMYGWMDGWIDRSMDRWIDGWMTGWMDSPDRVKNWQTYWCSCVIPQQSNHFITNTYRRMHCMYIHQLIIIFHLSFQGYISISDEDGSTFTTQCKALRENPEMDLLTVLTNVAGNLAKMKCDFADGTTSGQVSQVEHMLLKKLVLWFMLLPYSYMFQSLVLGKHCVIAIGVCSVWATNAW